MTRPTDPARRDPLQETEYVRKLLLGLMSTLETKGLMTETEISVIVRAAQQAVYTAPSPAPVAQPQEGPAPAQGASTPVALPQRTPTAPPLLDFTLD